jgi:hypothetical protein
MENQLAGPCLDDVPVPGNPISHNSTFQILDILQVGIIGVAFQTIMKETISLIAILAQGVHDNFSLVIVTLLAILALAAQYFLAKNKAQERQLERAHQASMAESQRIHERKLKEMESKGNKPTPYLKV